MAADDGPSHVAKWIKKRPTESAEPQPELGPKSR